MEIIMTRDNNIPEIDFVITWVDGNDPDWQKQKMEYSMPVSYTHLRAHET